MRHCKVSACADALCAVAAHSGGDTAAVEGHVAFALDALGVVGCHVEHEGATVDKRLAVVLVERVFRHRHVDAVALHACDVERAAVHLQVLLHVHAIAKGGGHVERAEVGVKLRVFIRCIGMLGVSRKVERARASELGMSVDEEAGLVRAACRIGKRGGCSFGQLHGDTLAVLDVDGRARGRG